AETLFAWPTPGALSEALDIPHSRCIARRSFVSFPSMMFRVPLVMTCCQNFSVSIMYSEYPHHASCRCHIKFSDTLGRVLSARGEASIPKRSAQSLGEQSSRSPTCEDPVEYGSHTCR